MWTLAACGGNVLRVCVCVCQLMAEVDIAQFKDVLIAHKKRTLEVFLQNASNPIPPDNYEVCFFFFSFSMALVYSLHL